MKKEFNTTTFIYKLIPEEYLQDDKINKNLSFNTHNPTSKIQNSKLLC